VGAVEAYHVLQLAAVEFVDLGGGCHVGGWGVVDGVRSGVCQGFKGAAAAAAAAATAAAAAAAAAAVAAALAAFKFFCLKINGERGERGPNYRI
jgi:hypothetical protein